MQNLSDLEIREKCLGMTDDQLQDAATNVARVYNVCKDIVDRRLMNGNEGYDGKWMNGMDRKWMDGKKSYNGYNGTGKYSPRMSPRMVARSRSLSPVSPRRYMSPVLSPRIPRRSLSPVMSSPLSPRSPRRMYMNGSGYNSAESGYVHSGESAMSRRTYGSSKGGVGSNDKYDGYDGKSYDGMSRSEAGRLGGLSPHKCRGRQCAHMSHKMNKGMDMMDSYDSMNGYNGYNGSKSHRKYHRSMSPRRHYSHEMNGKLEAGLIGGGVGALAGGAIAGPVGLVGGGLLGGGIGAAIAD